MSPFPGQEHGHHGVRRALSLAEAIVAVAIVGIMLVAALNAVGASQTTQKKTGDRGRGMLLAQDLMSEILQQHYEDPDFPSGSFGLGADEVGDGSRALWEDVDDYDGWSASPPQLKDGTVLTDFAGWGRSVAVHWANPASLDVGLPSDTGVKQITVIVKHGDALAAGLVAVRTNVVEFQPESD